ncbi:SMEK domain-containing protein [Pseudoalteromonas sp. NZS71_1]|uniref:SMEK domain-containing protein n=1 Tax=Pseudoalteromonas sp. NZS71_1 TaxID=2792072 RepID=UPI0018CFDF45|nr:SMEK domain-containing protein [Pseudoalteromonas sp. NZS71_1]MBH0033359.1 SMEK domain-containing protein [Pseudoalteromonas sp. NZS71_1]
MDIRRENALKALAERFATFSNVVTIQNKAGFNDINKSAERLFIDVLNIAYNLRLRDMNAIQDNYPAIDLGDYNAKTCVQVTSESSNQKFRSTVAKFKEKQLDRDFTELVFLIISNKDLCSLTDNDIDTRVINLNNLYKAISNLPDRDVFYIESYLAENLVSRIEQSDSILPSGLMTTYAMVRPNAFISFLGFESEPEYTDQLLNDLKSLSQKLSNLTKHQREYLFYVVGQGQFARNLYGHLDENNIVMPTNQAAQAFGGYGFQIFEVLKAQDLLFVNDEYDPHGDDRYISVLEPYFRGELDDGNLFCALKKFSNGDNNKLRRIILECDFSQLQ